MKVMTEEAKYFYQCALIYRIKIVDGRMKETLEDMFLIDTDESDCPLCWYSEWFYDGYNDIEACDLCPAGKSVGDDFCDVYTGVRASDELSALKKQLSLVKNRKTRG